MAAAVHRHRCGAAHDQEDEVADQRRTAGDGDGAHAMMTRIGQVVMLHRAGDREEARHRYLRIWAEIGEDGPPFQRCALAHFMAGTQDDPLDALAWDLRALSAAGEPAEQPAAAARGGPRALSAFVPSLHLSLAADYAKLGRTEAARSHLGRARRAAETLGDDGYGRTVRAAVGRLERILAPPEDM
jgi:hypothetical protein